MRKSVIILFLSGVALAIALAGWQYSQAPQGMLLYTPAPGVAPNYTPSSLVGFFVANLGLSAFSALTAIIGVVGGLFFNRRLFQIAKHAFFLFLGFGLLCLAAIATEKFWP